MKLRGQRFLSVVLGIGVIVTACTSAATPAPTPAPTSGGTEAPSTAPDGTLPKPELTSIKFGTTLGEASQFAPMLAKMLGLYEKYGIQVEVPVLATSADANQAVLAGQVEMGGISASAPISSLLTDTPLTVIAVQKVKVVDGLFCNKDIKSAADLKGKLVAASGLGGVAHASILLSLEALKMDQDDVVVQVVGAQDARIAALKSGAVACAPVGIDRKAELEGLGFNTLVDLSQTDLEYPANAISALASWLEKYPNTALVVLAAILEAQNYMITNQVDTAAKWAEFAQIDADLATKQIDDVQDVLDRSLRWSDAAFTFTQKVLAIVTPTVESVDPSKAYDRSYLQKLEDIGFYEKIGLPLP